MAVSHPNLSRLIGTTLIPEADIRSGGVVEQKGGEQLSVYGCASSISGRLFKQLPMT